MCPPFWIRYLLAPFTTSGSPSFSDSPVSLLLAMLERLTEIVILSSFVNSAKRYDEKVFLSKR